MILNIVNGKPKVGTITVTTTAGATVTCVLSPYTLTATATSGTATFTVPKSGTWTITSTKGSLSKSTTASITTYNGTASVTVTLEKYLYHTGTEDVAWTSYSDVDTKESTYLQVYGHTGYGFRTTNTVDLTQYTTLHVMFQSRSSEDGQALAVGYTTKRLSPSSSAPGAGYTIDTYNMTKWNSATGTYNVYKELTLDVSEASGSYYIYLFRVGNSSSYYYGGNNWVNNVWLT